MIKIWFASYNFMTDENSMDCTPAFPTSFNSVELKNGVFDEFMVNHEITSEQNTNREDWGYNTALLAKFANSVAAGSVDFVSSTVSKIRIKRRKVEDLSNWWTIAEIDFTPSLRFEIFDYLNEAEQEYEYALISVSTENGVEGNYLTNRILSTFEDCYITDGQSIYKFKYDLNYDNIEKIQKTAIFEPLESKYPVVVKNASTSYSVGGISSLILSSNTENGYGVIDKKQEVIHRKALLDFLTGSTSKFLKDSNGNSWLIFVTGNPQVAFRNELGQQIADVNFTWHEIGDSTSKEDMYYNNLLPSIN